MADAHKLTDEAFSEYESEVPTQQSKKSPNSVGQHWPSSPELLQASFTAQDAKSGVSVGGDVSPFLVGLFVGIFVGLNRTKSKTERFGENYRNIRKIDRLHRDKDFFILFSGLRRGFESREWCIAIFRWTTCWSINRNNNNGSIRR
jgi:hypothetical protein